MKESGILKKENALWMWPKTTVAQLQIFVLDALIVFAWYRHLYLQNALETPSDPENKVGDLCFSTVAMEIFTGVIFRLIERLFFADRMNILNRKCRAAKQVLMLHYICLFLFHLYGKKVELFTRAIHEVLVLSQRNPNRRNQYWYIAHSWMKIFLRDSWYKTHYPTAAVGAYRYWRGSKLCHEEEGPCEYLRIQKKLAPYCIMSFEAERKRERWWTRRVENHTRRRRKRHQQHGQRLAAANA